MTGPFFGSSSLRMNVETSQSLFAALPAWKLVSSRLMPGRYTEPSDGAAAGFQLWTCPPSSMSVKSPICAYMSVASAVTQSCPADAPQPDTPFVQKPAVDWNLPVVAPATLTLFVPALYE